MIKAPIGGLDMMQMQNIAPAVQNVRQDTGSDFKQAFESAKDTVSKADESTKVKRTDGTGAGGKDSGAAGQTADDSKVKQDINRKTGTDSSADVRDTSDVKTSANAGGTDRTVSETDKEELSFDTTEISKIAEKMILDIASLLGITPGELAGFLEDMGIGAEDLMVSENINILVADVKGGGDMISLAADADLMALAADINEAAVQMRELLDDMTAVTDEVVSKVFEDSLVKTVAQFNDADADAALKTDMSGMETAETETVVQAGDMKIENTAAVDDSGKGDASLNGGDDSKDTSADRRSIRQDSDHREDLSFTRIEVTGDMEVRPEDVLKADEGLKEYGSNTAEVVEQILDHMKAQVKLDMGGLEMVLHPASLGNVSVNITNNGGGLTAQFTVQNEAVREAIEAQVAVFKENLEQQGVKVEAVEVSVASHGFEENLEQGNDRNDAEDSERERLRKATRSIDLGAFGEDAPEDLDEAEEVTVDMMRSDGNRMNYRV
ncbi:MAG: flagellar hook-length control protein FliK [Lachnospiraceae bacterium]|nr:flagellar hook-length control protein FliK [Lachnospiraceae bacterium]